MSKKSKKAKKKSSLPDLKTVIEKMKHELDPKVRASKVKFKNETANRSMELYSLIAGVIILGVTVSTVVLPLNETYPFNFSQAGAVKQSIADANTTISKLEGVLSKATTDKEIVAKEKDRINKFSIYFPSKIDPLSFMVHLEKLAAKNGVTVHTLTLPENRRSAVLTDNVDVTQQGETPVEQTQSADNGTIMQNQDPNAAPPVEGAEQPTTPVTDEKPTVQDPGYVIDVKVVGMYSKLTAFFGDLENTKEIIDITDVVIQEYKPDLKEGETPPDESKPVIKADSFDMEKIQTEVTFKVRLYDDKTFAEYVNNILLHQEQFGTTNVQDTTQQGQTTTPDPTQQTDTTNGGVGQ